MTIFHDYIKITQQYQQEYGSRTILLYQVGSFYELYSTNDTLINLKEITELLNIQMTRKNKSITEVSETNYNMAGIPTFALQKYLKLLVAANYTVVIFDQTADGRRSVAEIVSAGTKLADLNPFESNMIMVAYFEEFAARHSKRRELLGIGVCFVDITTGKSYVDEFVSTEQDATLALDELYKFMMIYQPREIILLSSAPAASTDDVATQINAATQIDVATQIDAAKISAYLEINNSFAAVHDRIGRLPKEMQKNNYQRELLGKIFPAHGLVSPHEYVGLEYKTLAAIAYVYMLDFCYKHNDRILTNLKPPSELDKSESQICTIAYNAANQLGLHILAKQLNKCRTAIGRRSFRERLYMPLICEKELNARYDRVAGFIALLENKQTAAALVENLDKIYDVERIYRLLCMQKLQPADLPQITTTMEAIRALNKLSADLQFTKAGSARRIYEEINSVIDLTIAQKYSLATIEENFFISGIYPELDSLQSKLVANRELFTQVATAYHPEYFKVEYTERDGYYLTITKKRYDAIKSALFKMAPIYIANNIDENKDNTAHTLTFNWSDFELRPNTAIYKCISPQLIAANQCIAELKTTLADKVKYVYREFIYGLSEKYAILFTRLTQYIADIDWYYSCAKCAIEYKYFRPTIQLADNANAAHSNDNRRHASYLDANAALSDDNRRHASYLDARDLRHPIIEQILTNQEYIPNDIRLGAYNDMNMPTGILLYGVNSSGKSSLSKAVALAIIMAQVGMFVPANLTYWPYEQIFTRIPSGDDIIKGKSTFIIEISEMGNILKRATQNSLVIRDELASGTESVSALSIVGAGIAQLCARHTSFIFATHLHDLTAISHVKGLVTNAALAIYHLAVEYDAGTDCLIYQRKLANGQGKSIYGLEVCKALNLDTTFLNLANEIRHEVLGESADLFNRKKSRYNSALYLDLCKVCKAPAQEVHHIKQQQLADLTGYIGAIHKNHRANLVAICEKCHDAIHAGRIHLDGFRQTTAGVQLIIRS